MAINFANNWETMFPVKTSETKYYADLENSFQVLKDGKSIVGVCGPDRNQLFFEKIGSRESSYAFGKHESIIDSVVYDNKSQILAGDKSSTLVQYDFDNSSQFWIQKRRFSSLGVGDILSIAVLEHIAIVGGNNMHVRIIDLSKKKFLGSKINTSIGAICSLLLFYNQEIQMILAVTGHSVNKSVPMDNLINVSNYLSKGPMQNEISKVENKDNPKNEWYKNQFEQSKKFQEKQAKKLEKLEAKLQKEKIEKKRLYKQIEDLGGSPTKTRSNFKKAWAKTKKFKNSIKSFHYSYKKAIAKIKHLDRESVKMKQEIQKLTLKLHNAVDKVKQEVSDNFKKDLQIKRLLKNCKSRGLRKCICNPHQITKIDNKMKEKSEKIVNNMPTEFQNLKKFYDFDLKLLYLDCLHKINQSRRENEVKKRN